MHKAGSSIADLILVDFMRAKGYEIDRIATKAWKSPLAAPDFFLQYQSSIKTDGVYYGIARHPGTHDLNILPKLRIIAQIRDPRDCLVSAYFSLSGSHALPAAPEKRARFVERRAQTQALGLDNYVLQEADDYLMRMDKIRKIVETHPDGLLLKYETMVCNTDLWLTRISEFLEQPLSEALLHQVQDKADFSVAVEDAARHKRQVTPGDHKRKLKPETIVRLNDILGPVLREFDYAT